MAKKAMKIKQQSVNLNSPQENTIVAEFAAVLTLI